MAKILGFKKSSGGASPEQMIRIMEKTYLNRTATGEFSNESDVQGFLEVLNKMPQTPEVMEKVADLENTRLKILSKQDDILNSKYVFEDNLNDALRLDARNSYKNLPQLVSDYANNYANAEEEIDQYINTNIYARYGTSAPIPDDLIKLKNKIKDKVQFYGSLTLALATPEGQARLNTEGLAVQIKTNPVNGNIISLDVLPSGQVDSHFMRTDIKAKVSEDTSLSIPIFINPEKGQTTTDGSQTTYAKLGSVQLKGTSKAVKGDEDILAFGAGELKAQNEETTMWDWFKFGDAQVLEDEREGTNRGIDAAKTTGMTFNNLSFDGNDIAPGSIVRKGSRLYYQHENGDVSEFDGKDLTERKSNAQKYLLQTGDDSTKVDFPDYVDDTYFINSDGKYKVKDKIGADYFSPASPSNTGSSVFTPSATSTPQTVSATENPQLLSSFFNNKNRLDKPNAKTETTTPSFIAKAKGFFRTAA